MATYTLTYVPLPFSEHVTITTDEGTRKLRRDEEWTRSGRVITILDPGDAFSMDGPWRVEVQYAYAGTTSGLPPEGGDTGLEGVVEATSISVINFGTLDFNHTINIPDWGSWAPGDLLIYYTNQCRGGFSPAPPHVPTGWTVVDASTTLPAESEIIDTPYAVWAPASQAAIDAIDDFTVSYGYSAGAYFALLIHGADLTDPIQDYAHVLDNWFDGASTDSQSRAVITGDTETLVALNFSVYLERNDDDIPGVGVAVSSLGDAEVLFPAVEYGAPYLVAGIVGIGQLDPGGAPGWPSAVAITNAGFPGDWHMNFSLAIRGA